MRRVLERVNAMQPHTLSIRELRDTFSLIVDPHSEDRCNEQIELLGIVSIDVDGNISTFSPELLGMENASYGDFVFGNVHRNSLEDVLMNPHLIYTHAEIEEGVRHCAESCSHFDFCKGGAPANKLFENGTFASAGTLYCKLTKQVMFDLMLEHLETAFASEVS